MSVAVVKSISLTSRPEAAYGFRIWGILTTLLVTMVLLLSAPESQATAVDAENRRITLALASEPPNLNSTKVTDQISAFVLSHVQEGLLIYGPGGNLMPGVASQWQLSARGARFWLRRNAQWSDGKPVTARDFVFAWRHALRPDTASAYAFILFPVKNARSINAGQMPMEALGVRAVGDYELRVEFEQPCPYFLSLTAFPTYFPLRQDVYERWGSRYAADADKMVFNGAFMLTRWVHGAQLLLERNPRYWGREKIQINTIDIAHITSDPLAAYNLFKDKAVAMANLDADNLNDAMKRGYALYPFSSGSLFFLRFNFATGRATANPLLRKAMQAAFSPDTLVNKVLAIPGVRPSHSVYPGTVKGMERPLIEEYPPPPHRQDLALARHYMDMYLQELGLATPPRLVLLVGESAASVRQAEYLQHLFMAALGINVVLDKQVFKQRLAKEQQGDFDLVMAAWGPDYDDAMTFADLFASWNDNNRGGYVNPVYDELIQRAQTETDPSRRMQWLGQVQQILYEDVVILPMYEQAMLYVQHPQLKGVIRGIFGGDPNFHFARIEAPVKAGPSR